MASSIARFDPVAGAWYVRSANIRAMVSWTVSALLASPFPSLADTESIVSADTVSALQAAMQAESIQDRLPGDPTSDDSPQGRAQKAPVPAQALAKPTLSPMASSIGGAVDMVFWMIVITLGIVGADQLRQYLPSWEILSDDAAEGSSALKGGGEETGLPLNVADDLARSGRFAEAMHYLLLQALIVMAPKGGKPMDRSLTSRELLGQMEASDIHRSAFKILIESVERAWFGEYPAHADDYAQCRGVFEQVLQTTEKA